METNLKLQIIIFILCILLSAFFSSAETAYMSLSKIKVRNMIEDEVKNAELIKKLIDDSARLLSTILVGNNLVNIGGSSLATSVSIQLFGDVGVGIATGVVTLLVLIFGEITPKTLATENAERLVIAYAKPLSLLKIILGPATMILSAITGVIAKIFGATPASDKPLVTHDEFETMVNVSKEEGVIDQSEQAMIQNLLTFRESKGADVMTPRTSIVGVEVDATYHDIVESFSVEGYSRIPVYEDSLDDIIGIIYARDIIGYQDDPDDFELKKYLRDAVFVFENQSTTKILNRMRSQHVHLAVVVDEYGGTAGIITIEDLLEEIVGEIEDEFDHKKLNMIQMVGDDEYLIDGSLEISEFNKLFQADLSDDEYNSIAGFIIGLIESIPEEGQTTSFKHYHFTVEKMDGNRIEYIKLKEISS